MDSVEDLEMAEGDSSRLVLTYQGPSETPGQGLTRVIEHFECFEAK